MFKLKAPWRNFRPQKAAAIFNIQGQRWLPKRGGANGTRI